MNVTRKNLILFAIATAVFAAGFLVSRHLRHHHEHPGEAALSLDHGRPWATDVPLRNGMERIRAAALPVLEAHAQAKLTRAQAQAFSEFVTARFTEMAAQCKLPPKADATLHALIAELMRGAGLLAGDPTSREGAEVVRSVLRQYGDYFAHPNWSAASA